MAIQMIITKEFGLAKNENPLQGSFIIEELTDLVEEAVLAEFERIDQRGGVLGAMETQYQRSKIQDESMLYEHKKHSGELPIVGVNTFLHPRADEEGYHVPGELARATKEEKEQQIRNVRAFQERHRDKTADGARASSSNGRPGRQHFCRADGDGQGGLVGSDLARAL